MVERAPGCAQIISPPGGVSLVALAENGKLLAGYCWLDHTLRICDLAAGKELHKIEDPDVRAFSFSPDGSILVCAGESGIALRDVATAKTINRVALGMTGFGFAFAPDGKTLAVDAGGLNAIRLLDLATGKERFSFTGHT